MKMFSIYNKKKTINIHIKYVALPYTSKTFKVTN